MKQEIFLLRYILLSVICFSLISSALSQNDTSSKEFYNNTPNYRTEYFPKHRDIVNTVPRKENIWVFILAGQSNMAGRGQIEPVDTIPDNRVLTILSTGELVYAKEPLHFYEPSLTGLDCGLSFGKTLAQNIADSILVLIIPAAIGSSSIQHWLGDSVYRNVKLLTNFKEKLEIGKSYGTIKAVLWHQGEQNANDVDKLLYRQLLGELLTVFRIFANNMSLPVIIGELGSYSGNNQNWQSINETIRIYTAQDKNTFLISTQDFIDKGDKVHFNSNGQRKMGERFAEKYLQLIKN